MAEEPTFLPRPWHVSLTAGRFALDAATRIEVGAGASDATLRTARGIQDALADQTGLHLEIVPVGQPAAQGAIRIVLAGRDDATFPAATLGRSSPRDLGPQGYTLTVDDRGATIAATTEVGLFYGAQTLIQLGQVAGRLWPALAIADRPALPNRGLMLDVSRGKVPTPAILTRLARTLAHYKYNQLQLYIEHTFRFPSHPEIGAGAGSLTADDILALDQVCREHYVELVPNLQSLGHQRALLRLPRYEHLAETPWHWSFATTNEGSYRLLDELYADLLPAFSSRLFNVDADEPWDLGRGQSRALTDEIGPGRVYLRHVERIHDLVTKHGHQMMMWADMFWHYPELVGDFPDDIVLLDWWYERKDRHDTVDVLAKAGRRFYVCPGTSSWLALFPRLENAIANVRGFVRDGIAAGAEGMLMTDWGDRGHFQPLSNSWYPYLWAAEAAWTGGTTESADFDAAFGRLFLRDGSGRQVAALRRLGAAMQVDPSWTTTWHTAMALFEDPLVGRQADVAPPAVVAEAREAAEAIAPLLAEVRDPGLRHDLGFVAAQVRFVATKVETTRAIRALLTELASHDGATDDGRERLDAATAALRRQRAELPAMIREFEDRWLAEARRSEIAINLDRYARLLARYDAALAWLETQRTAYRDGRGVDATLASYDRGAYAVLHDEAFREIRELIDIIGLDTLPPDLQRFVATRQSAEA